MFKLQKLNVVRVVESETEKARLISQGFKEIEPSNNKKNRLK